MTTPTSRWPVEQDLAKVIGSRVRTLREARGLSQRALSQQLGLSKSMVAKYEAGVHTPPVGVLARLAALFEVTLDGLLFGQDAHDPHDLRLARCLRAIESMDEASRRLVIDAIEGIVNAYRILFEERRAPAAEPR